MPHAIEPVDNTADQDDLEIQRFMEAANRGDAVIPELEAGEKADDAVDYEDISDNDLADEEEATQVSIPPSIPKGENGASLEDTHDFLFEEEGQSSLLENGDTTDNLDDLFGDVPSSPVDQKATGQPQRLGSAGLEDVGVLDDIGMEQNSDEIDPIFRTIDYVGKQSALSREEQMQADLFAQAGTAMGGSEIPEPPQNYQELLAQLWPHFKQGSVPRFMDLLPPKKAHFTGRVPLRKPKPLPITRVNLEIAPDQERSFKLPLGAERNKYEDQEHNGIVTIETVSEAKEDEAVVLEDESDYENETVGGVSWQDLQIICEDWNTLDGPDAHDEDFPQPTAKRRKLDNAANGKLNNPTLDIPGLRDFETATARVAKNVILDLNDPLLLIDEEKSHSSRKRDRNENSKSIKRGTLTARLSQRYNTSNDEAYDLLKENHQSKVRNNLANLPLEHALPAEKLQWPFYNTKLSKHGARSFHRPQLEITPFEWCHFGASKVVKKKHTNKKTTHQIFNAAEDLTLGDNSKLLLVEYSEEHPMMLSNFGMASRLLNYYRRKNAEDQSRPKLDIGDTIVLLPQDKSPFSIFGPIDPGEMTPAIYNSMYRAPIFRHEGRGTDFLISKSGKHRSRANWSIKKLANLHIAGQEFPAVDVPGPHSRKVTTAAKNRLKMVSYRLARHSGSGRVDVKKITHHFPGTTDMQNRQKMKEFMAFSKENRAWEMRQGEALPEEESIRSMVKPEDVCLLESMQVGQQHLQDAGFSKGDDASDDDEGKEGQSIEQQLAPWYASRNFLQATQGKAMLQLHGEGDPSARGEAFNFIKTSMKGGFRAVGESTADRLDAKRLKELGGHSYNVAKQQKAYEDSIRRIWDAQKESLSRTEEPPDSEYEGESDRGESSFIGAGSPRSQAPTLTSARRREDDTMSQMSRFSVDSQSGKILRITRNIRNDAGQIEQVQEIIRDPRVIRQYMKKRFEKEAENTALSELLPTGDEDQDMRNKKILLKELERLKRNQGRRIARDKQKGISTDGAEDSPASPTSPNAPTPIQKPAGTLRKCANCGQVGHIKTNKKLCPLLNGTMKPEEGVNDSAFATSSVPL